MRKRPGLVLTWGLFAVVLASGSSRLFGQRMFEGIKGRIYAGLVFSYTNIMGESFSGENGFSGEAEFVAIPKLNASKGLGIVLGLRGEAVGVEISYFYHRHDGSVLDPTPQYQGHRPEKIGHHDINIDFKGHFWPASRLEGYYQAGLSTVFLSVNKAIFGLENVGSSSSPVYEYKAEGDVTYQAVGINFGLGLDFWLMRQIGLTVGVFYRPLFFTTLKESLPGEYSEYGTFDIDVSGMKGHGLGVMAGILVNLK